MRQATSLGPRITAQPRQDWPHVARGDGAHWAPAELGELTGFHGNVTGPGGRGCGVRGGVQVWRGLRRQLPCDDHGLPRVPGLAEEGQGIIVRGPFEGLAIYGKDLISLLNCPFLGGQPAGEHFVNLREPEGVTGIRPRFLLEEGESQWSNLEDSEAQESQAKCVLDQGCWHRGLPGHRTVATTASLASDRSPHSVLGCTTTILAERLVQALPYLLCQHFPEDFP